VEADLSAKPGRAKVENVLRNDPNITMLVNCAGVGWSGSILQADLAVVETVAAIIDLNVTALNCLTYAVAPAFLTRGKRTIINIASVVGIAAEALHGVYSASESYLLSFGQLLQSDLAERGVRVQIVPPGAATGLWNIVGYPPAKVAGIALPAETLVDTALAGPRRKGAGDLLWPLRGRAVERLASGPRGVRADSQDVPVGAPGKAPPNTGSEFMWLKDETRLLNRAWFNYETICGPRGRMPPVRQTRSRPALSTLNGGRHVPS
jgi:NAD(P)-dependent dehydrogenase (short-subunit alcohol dehydrogenase family)